MMYNENHMFFLFYLYLYNSLPLASSHVRIPVHELRKSDERKMKCKQMTDQLWAKESNFIQAQYKRTINACLLLTCDLYVQHM